MELIESQILSQTQVLQKIRRIAFEIYENNFEESDIVIAGIRGQGHALAKLLANALQEISPIEASAVLIDVDKDVTYESPVEFDCDERFLEHKTIVVVDDVLNSGRTLAYSLSPFLSIPVKRIQVAVMVDRNYRRFPILADYVGYELSTTLSEYVSVVLDDEARMGVYLK
ncbi:MULTISPECIES: phosphoribosyltransferase family protein [unclassified Arcicella]|uniref:phosphoribosyltransferase family protein n=1 Tax=unclassified Arcicella TaxID=2644986 RepID=UPI00285A888D|nr:MULTISPECIES: phosphoribosyltransferase family protein [unclassified Arcicella]MDR6560576.1 pyrimidine operon attenuation protein/uracil phosphoribosyltransferase [Arcicella sp. BE51]MDR6814659.1 pyrimidine operon attenuation protein/uracil phosphoribosyltransferase [Arcicella sp. BE140]MDR6826105.1 pyrimidine operon attenuation protein/uracil phosphoribosyltransferase [Arcicella sp. BE139]